MKAARLRTRLGPVLIAALTLAASFDAAAAASASGKAEAARMRRLAGERGCTVCHREAPPPRGADAGVPLAPSWHEIARRYRGDADAGKRLASVVLGGADSSDRHWKDRLDFTQMQGNDARLTPGEARKLVRWILASP